MVVIKIRSYLEWGGEIVSGKQVGNEPLKKATKLVEGGGLIMEFINYPLLVILVWRWKWKRKWKEAMSKLIIHHVKHAQKLKILNPKSSEQQTVLFIKK